MIYKFSSGQGGTAESRIEVGGKVGNVLGEPMKKKWGEEQYMMIYNFAREATVFFYWHEGKDRDWVRGFEVKRKLSVFWRSGDKIDQKETERDLTKAIWESSTAVLWRERESGDETECEELLDYELTNKQRKNINCVLRITIFLLTSKIHAGSGVVINVEINSLFSFPLRNNWCWKRER